jgi:hypothetical protein
VWWFVTVQAAPRNLLAALLDHTSKAGGRILTLSASPFTGNDEPVLADDAG